LGLVPAIQWVLSRLYGQFNIEGFLEVSPTFSTVELSKDQQAHVFRVIQEALTNVRKHSGANSVWIAIAVTDHICSIRVWDNGHGLEAKPYQNSLGFTSMNERAASLGGQIRFSDLSKSSDAKGFEVHLVFNVSERKEKNESHQRV
jgi:signal transduction histidine kinase